MPKERMLHVKGHESHTRYGEPEYVRPHEMKEPSYEGGASTKLTGEDRDKFPDSAFALSGRRYPVPTVKQYEEYLGWSHRRAEDAGERHAINALARVAQHGSAEEQNEVRHTVHERYPMVDGKAMEIGFPAYKGRHEVYVAGHHVEGYRVPAHESHSKTGAREEVKAHRVKGHRQPGYEVEYNG